MVSFGKYSAVSRKKVCLLHTHYTIYHIQYSMVGRSIASISDLGGMVRYIGYGLPYHTVCIIYSTVGGSIADILD